MLCPLVRGLSSKKIVPLCPAGKSQPGEGSPMHIACAIGLDTLGSPEGGTPFQRSLKLSWFLVATVQWDAKAFGVSVRSSYTQKPHAPMPPNHTSAVYTKAPQTGFIISENISNYFTVDTAQSGHASYKEIGKSINFGKLAGPCGHNIGMVHCVANSLPPSL